jgi:acyl-CoA reductase-like NAD-dependent aldehyde dehydrogenase
MKSEVHFTNDVVKTWHGDSGMNETGFDIKTPSGVVINIPWNNVLWVSITPDLPTSPPRPA